MLIRRIEIRNFKKLVGPIILEGFTDGINIIAGDNEEGKSTLMHAIKAAIFQRHNSKTQTVSDYRPFNKSVRPEVTLEIELESLRYSIRKGFWLKPNAEFRSPQGIVEGSEAEEKIRELFGLNFGDKNKKPDQDSGIWGLLWLEQGKAGDGLGTSDGGKESLMRALENDISNVTGGQRGRLLQKRIEKQLLNYYTAKKTDERGDLAKASEILNAKKAELQICQENFDEYEKKLAKLQEVQERLANADKTKAHEKAKEELDKAIKYLALLEQLTVQLDAASSAESSALRDMEYWSEKVEERKKLSQKVADTKILLASLEADLEQRKAQDLRESQDQSKAEKQLAAAKQIHDVIAQKCKTAEQQEELRRIVQQKDDLQTKQTILKEMHSRIAELVKQIGVLKIDSVALEKLRTINSELMSAEVRANAAATKIIFKPLESNKATIDGSALDTGADLSIIKETSIKLDTWGEIKIIPGGEKTADFAKVFESKKIELSKALEVLGFSSLSEAEDQLNQRKDLELQLASSKREIMNNGGPKALEEITQALVVLESTEKKLSEQVGQIDTSIKLQDLRFELEEANAALNKAKSELDKTKEVLNKTRLASSKTEGELNSCRAALKDLEQRQADSTKTSEIDLDKQLTEAQLKVMEKRAHTKEKRDALADLKEAELREQKDEAARKLRQIELLLKQLNEDKIRLSTEINAVGLSGLGEKLDKLIGEIEVSEKRLEQVRTRAQALKLLHETLSEAETESRSKVMQPVMTILRPQLSRLFPGSELTIDEGRFEISHLLRDGQEEDFKSLSLGTKEQLSVLTRIAMAKLLKQQGQSSLLLLDDALVYSDDTRFALMKDIIREAAKEMQVILLTCRQRDYSDMDDAFIRRLHPSELATKPS